MFRRPSENLDQREPGRVRERFHVICKALLDEGVIARLNRKGVYWRPRAKLNPTARHDQHFLTVVAESGEDAVEQARDLVQDAGGDASELTLVGPKTE